ncbi:MAG: choice-of-anchor Q domain-containing protein, partial [Bacteroidota bacterium]
NVDPSDQEGEISYGSFFGSTTPPTSGIYIAHSTVQNGWDGPGENNLDLYPEFVDTTFSSLDLRLGLGSPAIDAGSSKFVISNTDLAGLPRVIGEAVDMGAYEFQRIICSLNSILFVDADAGGQNDGSSWTNAYTDLQDALATARNCGDVTAIWLAEGTYVPTDGLDRKVTFQLVDGVSLYGGFDGNESTISDRDWTLHPTILSGILGLEPVNNDTVHSYSVVSGENLSDNTIIDGLTIRDAENWSGTEDNLGGGMFLSKTDPTLITNPIIRNCSFVSNVNDIFDGGGLRLVNVSPLIDACLFQDNYTDDEGGGLYITGVDSLRITNSRFIDNESLDPGGAISVQIPQLDIENCVFTGNYASTGGGGGIFTGEGNVLTIRNSTFFSNNVYSEDANGSALLLSGSTQVFNSIFWRNGNQYFAKPGDDLDQSEDDFPFWGNLEELTLSHCLYQSGWPGEGNIDADPLFVDVTTGDLSLLAESPAINAGLNTTVESLTDLAGNPRIFEGTVDMGAYEFQDITLPTVTRFMLINADTDLPIREINSGDMLNYATLGPVNIEAQTQGDVSSVKFEMEGPIRLRRTENRPPWSLFGDNNGDYRASTLFPGIYTLKATPYQLPAAVGESGTTKEIEFEVFGSNGSLPDHPFLVQLYPNPTNGISTLSIPTDWQGDTKLKLMDKTGRVVWTSTLSSGIRSKKLEFTNLAQGVYLLRVNNEERFETKKLIIRN